MSDPLIKDKNQKFANDVAKTDILSDQEVHAPVSSSIFDSLKNNSLFTAGFGLFGKFDFMDFMIFLLYNIQ